MARASRFPNKPARVDGTACHGRTPRRLPPGRGFRSHSQGARPGAQNVEAHIAPLGATPEPSATTGGSARRFTGALWIQSHPKNAAIRTQNTAAVRREFTAFPSQSPKWRRTRRPLMEPMNAIATQIQPCRLPVEIPPTIAPMLQPNARREL